MKKERKTSTTIEPTTLEKKRGNGTFRAAHVILAIPLHEYQTASTRISTVWGAVADIDFSEIPTPWSSRAISKTIVLPLPGSPFYPEQLFSLFADLISLVCSFVHLSSKHQLPSSNQGKSIKLRAMAEASGSCTGRPGILSCSGETASAGQGVDGRSSGTEVALLAIRAAATEVAVLAR